METRGRRALLASALLAAVAAWACDEGPAGIAEPDDAGVEPRFHETPPPIRITGGGRVDFPPGTEPKNTPDSHDFQTWGFVIGDPDGSGPEPPKGQFQFVDHRPELRIDGSPLNLHVVSWDYFIPMVTDACVDGGGIAEGTLEVKNDGRRVHFQLRVCDNGEPGNKDPHDTFELQVPELSDPMTGGPYHIRNQRDGAGALLTGGNIQAHRARP